MKPKGRFRKFQVMCHFYKGSRPMPVSSGYPLFLRWTKDDAAQFVEVVWDLKHLKNLGLLPC